MQLLRYALALSLLVFAMPLSTAEASVASPANQGCLFGGIEVVGGDVGSFGTTLDLLWRDCGVDVLVNATVEPDTFLIAHKLVIGSKPLLLPFQLPTPPFAFFSILEVIPEDIQGPFPGLSSRQILPEDPSLIDATFYVQGVSVNFRPATNTSILGLSQKAAITFRM